MPRTILEEKVANMAPSWVQVGIKMDKTSIQKSIKKLMPPGLGFWKEFGGFWEGEWSQVGTKMGSKIEFSENMKKRIWS